ncbi:hypothetical protein [Lysinibacillus telephonicus]|uniref:Uncharacterized protein n=1 Tax=Lysinibacillus telephonicus TaxID=1714840 RepID=A0A431UWK4_9BACI|nr:hypothetical protein [Lysinibacillus telephonicus]RTQ95815.1 hypothetical protein EKG35_02215 [Lysinibacillus telephonicus]
MKFPKGIGRRDLTYAAILGSVAGLAGVLFFILLLSSMNTTETETAEQTSQGKEEEVIPVQSTNNNIEVDSSVEFFANQHGVFSSQAAALEFTSGYASLNTSAVVEVDGSYYVWSSVTPIKEDIVLSDNPTSFVKPFKLSGGACTNPEIQSLPKNLQSNDRSKFYFEEGNVPENIPEDWQSITSAISSLSDDLGVARLHLIAHYMTKNDCLKIEF